MFSPWRQAPYRDAVERNPFGGLTLDGFLSEWSLMALLDPTFCVENLLYIGYAGDPQSAICVTQRRRLDCKTQQSNRNVSLRNIMLKFGVIKSFLEEDVPDSDYHYAINVVDRPGGKKKTLVLREIQEDGIKEFLSKGDVLPRCDVAVFVHDSSCESSWKKATELLFDVASRGEATGYGFPCLVIAAKDDLDQYPNQVQDSARVCRELGIEAPIPVSSKLGDLSDIFSKIVRAAEQPHLSIPETEAGRRCKHYHQLVNRSLKFVSVGAAVTFVGLVAYRAYAARRNSSG
ncbi:hypothetical protein M9H77_35052 [Catharanthus roseus]|uniref:Uncharacterized protein n=1 Tax=Catharanthus roseus TaxID=4058 RepID=A0ACB9ZQ23_CATRO|nr:hypothetical protein M9H77_35052 [Catharanthus roseus]